MSASSPQSRLNEFITSTPASKRRVSLLYDFSESDLVKGFKTREHFKSLNKRHSSLLEEFQHLNGQIVPDDEFMGFLVHTLKGEEFMENFCGHTGTEKIEGLRWEDLRTEIMSYCNTMDQLVSDIAKLEGPGGLVSKESVRHSERVRLDPERGQAPIGY